jgi:hypothetical protein
LTDWLKSEVLRGWHAERAGRVSCQLYPLDPFSLGVYMCAYVCALKIHSLLCIMRSSKRGAVSGSRQIIFQSHLSTKSSFVADATICTRRCRKVTKSENSLVSFVIKRHSFQLGVQK